jgi:uncharacterized protein (DUF58 family)
MRPTTRSAALLAVFAALAVIVPVGAILALALALAAAMLVDALRVRAAPRVTRKIDGVLARGVRARLSVRAFADDGRRVLLRQAATPALAVFARAAPQSLQGEVVPVRRGRHVLPGVASASVGALGLARWHHPDGAPEELLVYPDVYRARALALRLREGRAAPAGRLRRGPLGLGTDFESIRDYAPDDDIRQVNWRASARLGRPMSNQYRIEKDHDVICLIDAGRLMEARAASGTLLDAALDALAAVAAVADELGDRFGAAAFDAEIVRAVAPSRLGARRALRAFFDLQPSSVDSDFERTAVWVGGSRRGFVLVLSDLVDERAARSLVRAAPMLARRHALAVASVSDVALEQALAREDDDALVLAALSVVGAREAAAARLRAVGADLVIAAADALPERCVRAYLRAKSRARV